ncbi:hypothetical protein B0H11DRAFT_2291792 [Mycena galericulata]|nr:hypothetical protein B0H11DRAFT_2291789 [Mycena galericulata]KAJ7443339.1 hypothetical protein B0H11DRAFT_2291792 [Mycena galericulata]
MTTSLSIVLPPSSSVAAHLAFDVEARRQRDQDAYRLLAEAHQRLNNADALVKAQLERLDRAWDRIREFDLLPLDGLPATRREYDAVFEKKYLEILRLKAKEVKRNPGKKGKKGKKGKTPSVEPKPKADNGVVQPSRRSCRQAPQQAKSTSE